MKIKKLGKILAILCMFAVLCGCADSGANNPDKSSTEQSAESSTVSEQTNSSENLEISSDTPSSPKPQPVDIGNGMTLTGTLLDRSELKEFSADPLVERYPMVEQDGEFIDSLGISELKDIYKRSCCLARFGLNPLGFILAHKIPENVWIIDNKKVSEIPMEIRYYQTGFTYESFYNEYLRTFTPETVDKLLVYRGYNVFMDYNGGLFCTDGTIGGWLGEVHREYELTSKNDSVIEFRILTFHKDSEDKPAAEWNPDLRNEYGIGITEFKFVLTEDGWRAANIPEEYEAGI